MVRENIDIVLMTNPDGEGVRCVLSCEGRGLCDVYEKGRKLAVDFVDLDSHIGLVELDAFIAALERSRRNLLAK